MVQAVRGMRDVLPAEARRWRYVEDRLCTTLRQFAYEEVQLPLLEFTELFARGVGESTDIVEKEMYTLADRDGDSLSLRPEGTAGCVRALQENGLLYNQTQRVFYTGSMFRYEKPQRGRYRQFSQVGAEAFGFAGPDVDAELIAIAARCWQVLGLTNHVRLEINTLGSSDARAAYRAALVEYLTPLAKQLDEDSQRRLLTNPLRILDSKNEATQVLLAQAPRLTDFVDEAGHVHFNTLRTLLDELGVGYVVNPNLVRGLDYYAHTVFEWITDALGSQGTICGGGRYDGLVQQLGGKAMPAAGFGMGVDRVVLLHESVHGDVVKSAVDIYLCYTQPQYLAFASEIAQQLRETQKIAVRVHMGGGNLKKQLKRADGCNATWALIIGQQEREEEFLTLKHMATGVQDRVDRNSLVQRVLVHSADADVTE
ncbi:MAG: histidine--tRNA ligase [Gammaproteobacteria bacterium]|nr:histidine--tRNA ligase [Gammaproteobacteria bacterium]